MAIQFVNEATGEGHWNPYHWRGRCDHLIFCTGRVLHSTVEFNVYSSLSIELYDHETLCA